MPAHSDHIRRDAQHASRSDIMVQISKYTRRVNEAAKAHIEQALAAETEGTIDGTALGREAAAVAISTYIGSAEVHEAIEVGGSSLEIEQESAGL